MVALLTFERTTELVHAKGSHKNTVWDQLRNRCSTCRDNTHTAGEPLGCARW
jgi:hypothetical protein